MSSEGSARPPSMWQQVEDVLRSVPPPEEATWRQVDNMLGRLEFTLQDYKALVGEYGAGSPQAQAKGEEVMSLLRWLGEEGEHGRAWKLVRRVIFEME